MKHQAIKMVTATGPKITRPVKNQVRKRTPRLRGSAGLDSLTRLLIFGARVMIIPSAASRRQSDAGSRSVKASQRTFSLGPSSPSAHPPGPPNDGDPARQKQGGKQLAPYSTVTDLARLRG